jgi:hypothetical protein
LPPRLRKFKVTSILRSRIFGAGDREKRGGSTWSSGQGMGTSTILGNPLRISSNVLRSCSSSTKERDCDHWKLDDGGLELLVKWKGGEGDMGALRERGGDGGT